MPLRLTQIRFLFALILPASLLFGLVLFINSNAFDEHQDTMTWAITADMLFFVPLVYWLLIRKSKIPQLTVIPVFIAGIILASINLPTENQYFLSLVKTWFLPVLELSIFTIVVIKIRKIRKAYKAEMLIRQDFYSSLKTSVGEAINPKVAALLAVELSVIYYGFIIWKKRKLANNEFSYHKNAGSIALLSVFVFIILVEATALHFVLAQWSLIAAWILTGLSLYTGLQVFGIVRSLSKRPHIICGEKVILRYGFAAETTIAIDNIVDIELSQKDVELDNETRKLSLLGAMEGHNVIIRLKEPAVWEGIYGMKKNYTTLLTFVDESHQFVNQIKGHK